MHHVEKLAWGILALVVLTGTAALIFVARQEFDACPVSTNLNFKEVVAMLTDIVKWGIGISVGAVGLFGSQLLLLKDSPKYSRTGHLMVVAVLVSMCLAAYFGLHWQARVAQAWFLNCPTLISTPYLQHSFDLLTYFLACGLGVLALMGLLLTFFKSKG